MAICIAPASTGEMKRPRGGGACRRSIASTAGSSWPPKRSGSASF
jgi:hypothetical protein